MNFLEFEVHTTHVIRCNVKGKSFGENREEGALAVLIINDLALLASRQILDLTAFLPSCIELRSLLLSSI